MKTLTVKEELQCDKKHGHFYYESSHNVLVRDIVIDVGLNTEVSIGHISDIHYNYCNQLDIDEADPVLMSTLERRKWLANGDSVTQGRNCYNLLDDMDLVVFNGDTLDYLSYGAMELMQREVWDRFPNVIATVGGHELCRQMQGIVPETLYYDDRFEILKNFWKHNVYYTSRLLKDKVMIVGMCNDGAKFNDYQYKCLNYDIELSRKNGYIMLLFVHEPICTGDIAHQKVEIDSSCVLKVGDSSGFPKDLYNGNTRGQKIVGSQLCDETTNAVYYQIVGNADVIKGVFAGHYHSEMSFDIIAKTSDGTPAFIPQHIKTASAYESGNIMRILVK